jgi:hypothetical protein
MVPNAKTHLGSFFTYGINDERWSVGLESKRMCSSHAFGGHSTVYSGSILYPKEEDLEEWPPESRPKSSDYRAVLSKFDVLSADDTIQEEFPIFPTDKSLHNNHDDKNIALLGFSRIATAKKNVTQCEKAKIFCTADYFKELREKKRITYRSNVYIIKVEKRKNKLCLLLENDQGIKELSDEFDAVFLGAGCINTTGVVDRSLFGTGTREYQLKSPLGFFCAFLRLGLSIDQNHRIRRQSNLPELFLETKSPSTSGTWSHTQITAINEQILSAISSKIFLCKGIFAQILRNIIYFSGTVVHSRFGTQNLIKTITTQLSDGKIEYSISVEETEQPSYDPKIRATLFNAVRKHWKYLRLIPIPFGGLIGDFFRGNKLGGWHYGGTLPMKICPKIDQCHPSGEVSGISGVYVLDSASFPEIPGSTVALLTSANAHRVGMMWRKKSKQKEQRNSCQ